MSKLIVASTIITPTISFSVSCSSNNTTVQKDTKTWGDEAFITKYNNLTYKDDADGVELINEIDYSEPTSNTTYQMLVYSFADGNNDGIGDFIGAEAKIPYLTSLGIDQIWLSPIHPASSYHGYDVIDYTDVAPELGGMEAFDSFLEAAHKSNIKIYLDQIFNHTSYEHPWFQEALANPDSKYRDYYNFDNQHEGNTDWHSDDSSKMSLFLNDFDRERTPTGDWYFGDFWAGMPDLNLDNPEVLNEIKHSQRFWTKKGVDGYRYDAFYHYFDGPNEYSSEYNPARVFTELREASNLGAKESNRSNQFDTYMFGEWWKTPQEGNEHLSYNGERALDSVYDNSVANGASPIFASSAEDKVVSIESASSNGQWMPILNHHDINRWMVNYRTNIKNINIEEQKVEDITQNDVNALATSLFGILSQPSNPIIYYGDELAYFGMKNPGDPSLRESMNWNDPQYNVDFYERRSGESNAIKLGISSSRPSADSQMKSSTTFDVIRDMNELRKEYQFLGLTNSNTLLSAASFTNDAWSWGTNVRQSEDGKVKILFAWTGEGERELNLNTPVNKSDILIAGPGTTFDGETLKLPARSFAAIQL